MPTYKRLDDAFFGAVNLFLPHQIDGSVLIVGDDEVLAVSVSKRSSEIIQVTKNKGGAYIVKGIGTNHRQLSSDCLVGLVDRIEVVIVIDADCCYQVLKLGPIFLYVNHIIGRADLISIFSRCLDSSVKFCSEEVCLRTTGEVFSRDRFNNNLKFPVRMYFEKGRFLKNLILRIGAVLPLIYRLVFVNKVYFLRRNEELSKTLLSDIFATAKELFDGNTARVQRCLISSSHVVILELVGQPDKKGLLVRLPLNAVSTSRVSFNCETNSESGGVSGSLFAGITCSVSITSTSNTV